MTNIAMTTAAAPGVKAERALRTVLGLNAATSMAAGIAGLAAAPWLTTTLGIPDVAWTRWVSAGLALFAIAVAAGSRRPPAGLRTAAALTSAADLAWVAGTVLVLAGADLTTAGRVVAIVLGIGVIDFAVLQLWLRARIA